MHELLHEPTRLLIAAAIVCFVFWVAGRLKKASALVDDILRPGDAVASVEDGTTPSLAVWRGLSADQQEAMTRRCWIWRSRRSWTRVRTPRRPLRSSSLRR